jgi:uncharacterized Ntn-hydrolase superfamily protein
MLYPSTFSIVAYDRVDKAWGVAVASKFLAAGALVAWARAGSGAVATQAHANTSYGPRGLDLMASGLSAVETLEDLISDDQDREKRQVGLVDVNGEAVNFTGESCLNWAGGITGDGFAVQGNILNGESVIKAMYQSFIDNHSQPIPWRLHTALLAGDRAGGDRRGKQSASIYIVKHQGGYGGYTDRWIDYRVDDHLDPVIRLGQLLELHDLYFGKSPISDQVELIGAPLRNLQDLMRFLGYYHGEVHGKYDVPTRVALEAFIGSENFEERTHLDAGRIDRPVLAYLLNYFKDVQ